MTSRRFAVDGNEYEVRVARVGTSTVVQCFVGDKPAGPRYSAEDDTSSDFAETLGKSAVTELIRIAVGDIASKNLQL